MRQLITSDNLLFQKKSCNCGFQNGNISNVLTTARNKKSQIKKKSRKNNKKKL
jgi:hypothetical protein